MTKGLLVPPLVAAAAVRVVVAVADAVPTSDATIYFTAGESALAGDGYARYGVPEVNQAPPVPVLLAALARLTGDLASAFSLHNLVWGTLLVLPVAGVARAVVAARGGEGGRADRAAVRAAWAVALCPGLAVAVTIDGGGTEVPAVVGLTTALWLVVDARHLPTGWRAAAVGLCCGGAALARADALVLGLVVVVALLVRVWRARPPRWVSALGAAGLALLVLAATVLPWVLWVRSQTGELQLTAKAVDSSLASWEALARHDRAARDELLYRLDDQGEIARQQEITLTELAQEDPGTFFEVQQANLHTLLTEVGQPEADFEGDLSWLPPTWELVPLPALGLAAWAGWRRWREARVQLLLGLAAANVAVALSFFVQDRYLAQSVVVACVLAAVGLADLRTDWWRRVLEVGLVVLCLLAVTAQLSGPRGLLQRPEPTEQQAAGELLAEVAPDDDVMTRSIVLRSYLGQPTVGFPYGSAEDVVGYAQRKGAELVVVDERSFTRLRPELDEWFTRDPGAGLELEWELEVDGHWVRAFRVPPKA